MEKQTTQKLVEETMVDGKQVFLTHADVPIGEIGLDRDNPRIRYKLSLQPHTGKPLTDAALAKLLLSEPDVRKLSRDIEQTGGLRERVILQKHGDKYKTVEGNCRLSSYLELQKLYPKDPRWLQIPARILSDDVTERQVAILLSDFHVAGKIQWNAHEKAGQIYHMHHNLKMSQEKIALYHRSSKSVINRILTAYEFMMDQFLKIDNAKYAGKGQGKWSYFDEFFKKKELKQKLKEDPTFGDQFCRWVGEETLPYPADVRLLPAILRNDGALEKLQDGADFEAVRRTVEQAEPEQGSDFFRLLAKVQDACSSAAQVKEILRIRTDPVARKRVLATYDALVDFMLLADVEIPKTSN